MHSFDSCFVFVFVNVLGTQFELIESSSHSLKQNYSLFSNIFLQKCLLPNNFKKSFIFISPSESSSIVLTISSAKS